MELRPWALTPKFILSPKVQRLLVEVAIHGANDYEGEKFEEVEVERVDSKKTQKTSWLSRLLEKKIEDEMIGNELDLQQVEELEKIVDYKKIKIEYKLDGDLEQDLKK